MSFPTLFIPCNIIQFSYHYLQKYKIVLFVIHRKPLSGDFQMSMIHVGPRNPPKIVETLRPIDVELGLLTPQQIEAITQILRIFLGEIRKLLAQSDERLEGSKYAPKPRCSGCGFGPTVDKYEKFTSTVYSILTSFRDARIVKKSITVSPFYCHCNQPGYENDLFDVNNALICQGFYSITTAYGDKARLLALETMKKIEAIAPRIDTKK